MEKIKGKIYLTIIIILISSLIFINYHRQFLKIIYPFNYKETIFSEAKNNELDPYLIAAIIYVESKFKPEAVSRSGAIGLMQIMPGTGHEIAQNFADDNFSLGDLYQPELNIKYGSFYLAKLKERFNNHLPITIAAYNGGQGNVRRWIGEQKWDGSLEKIKEIPFPETSDYVDKVFRTYKRYKYIYGDQ